jgi:hypothetical protein
MKDIQQLNDAVKSKRVELKLLNMFKQEKNIVVSAGDYFRKYEAVRIHEMNEMQARNYAVWAGVLSLV